MNSVDVIWVNNWSTPTKQFEGLDAWMKGGGKLLETLPATNSQQIMLISGLFLKIALQKLEICLQQHTQIACWMKDII